MEDGANAEDREHLSALSIGHFILAGVALFSGIPVLVYGVMGAKLMDELGSDLSMAMGDLPGQPGASEVIPNPDALLQDVGSLLVATIVAGLAVALLSAIHGQRPSAKRPRSSPSPAPIADAAAPAAATPRLAARPGKRLHSQYAAAGRGCQGSLCRLRAPLRGASESRRDDRSSGRPDQPGRTRKRGGTSPVATK